MEAVRKRLASCSNLGTYQRLTPTLQLSICLKTCVSHQFSVFPSRRDLGCPVNPALPLRKQHTSYHASVNTCLFDLAASIEQRFFSMVSIMGFHWELFIQSPFYQWENFMCSCTVKCGTQPAHTLTVRVQVTASHGSSSECTKPCPDSHLPASYTAMHLTSCQSSSLAWSPLKRAEIADDNPLM